MNITKKTKPSIFEWISNDGKFHNMTLTTEGDLFMDPEQEAAAEWFWLYTDGVFCAKENGEFHCVGGRSDTTQAFEVIVGKTAMNPIEDVGFFLHSLEPVVDEDQSFLALLQYKEVLAMVVAVGSISPRIYMTLLDHTPEDEAFMKINFTNILRRCNPDMVDFLTESQRMMPMSHMMVASRI